MITFINEVGNFCILLLTVFHPVVVNSTYSMPRTLQLGAYHYIEPNYKLVLINKSLN